MVSNMVCIGNTIYNDEWIQALITGSKNLINPQTDMILQTVFYELYVNMDRKQPHYKATLNAIFTDLIFCGIEGSLNIPDTYLKVFGMGRIMHNTKLVRLKKWKRGF